LDELYDQVDAKNIEAKKFYVLYNQWEDSRVQLEKEFSLLNSIMDSFKVASSSLAARDEFVSQFESILANLVRTRTRIEERILKEKDRKEGFNKELQQHREKQRLYMKLIDKFRKECTRMRT